MDSKLLWTLTFLTPTSQLRFVGNAESLLVGSISSVLPTFIARICPSPLFRLLIILYMEISRNSLLQDSAVVCRVFMVLFIYVTWTAIRSTTRYR